MRDDAEQKAYDLNAEHLAHPKFTYFWSGLFDTGLALTRGNSSTTTFTLATKEVRETPKDKLTVYATYIYGNDSTTPPSRTTANGLMPVSDMTGTLPKNCLRSGSPATRPMPCSTLIFGRPTVVASVTTSSITPPLPSMCLPV